MRAVDEERHRLGPAQLVHTQGWHDCRHTQRRDGEYLLAGHAQRLTAGREDAQHGAGGEQIGNQGRRRDHLLEVIEHQQGSSAVQVLLERGSRGVRLVVLDAQRLGDRGGDQVRVRDGGERDKQHATVERLDQCGRHLDGQPSLARPRRADERNESRRMRVPSG